MTYVLKVSVSDSNAASPCSSAIGTNKAANDGKDSASCSARHISMVLPWARCCPTLKKCCTCRIQ